MSKKRIIPVALLCMIVLAGCMAGPNTAAGDSSWNVVEFDAILLGFWHGLIFPLTVILSLFTDEVHFYMFDNSGHWYDIGYALGLVVILGGGIFGSSRRTRR